jgi:hypothetical protein
MAEHRLNGFGICSFPHEETRQAVPQVVESEPYFLAFLSTPAFTAPNACDSRPRELMTCASIRAWPTCWSSRSF